jgi:hypothetical protein
MAIRGIEILEQYHGWLLAASRGFPLFDPSFWLLRLRQHRQRVHR